MKSRWAVLLAALLGAVVVYLPLLESDFTNWDDPAQVLDNPNVTGFRFQRIPAVFSSTVVSEYHPIVTVIYAVEYRLFAPSGFFFHLGNLLWHLLNIALVFLLLRRLGVVRPVSLLAGCILFALHPFQVASLGWVSARKDLVCASCYLLAVLTYLGPRSIRRQGLVVLFTAAAILAKAVAVTIPVVLLALDLARGQKDWKKNLRLLLPLLLVGVLFGLFALQLQPLKRGRENPGMKAILPASRALLFYLGRGCFPLRLSTIYPEMPGEYSLTGRSLLRVFGAAGILVGAGAVVFRGRRIGRLRLAAWGAFFCLFNLLPVLRLVPFGGEEIVAARFLYIPLAGLAVALALSLEMHPPSGAGRAALALIGLSLILGNLDYQDPWRSGENFWKRAIACHPDYPIAHHQLGDAYWRAGRVREAALSCSRALELDPGLEKAWMGKGVSLWTLGERAEAVAVLEEGATELTRRGRTAGAETVRRCLTDYRKRLELDPVEPPQTQDKYP